MCMSTLSHCVCGPLCIHKLNYFSVIRCVALFTHSRVSKGWTGLRIVKHFFVRGAVLIFFDRIVNMYDLHPSFSLPA
jgi:hypothetical protein